MVMDFQYPFALAGLLVGFVVGLTGVGGGSLMTPILLAFGISPSTAVGTDLLYASITKMGGVHVHHKKNNINWRITLFLALGSVPAALVTLWLLHSSGLDTATVNKVIKKSLGWAMLFTAIAIIFKQQIMNFSQRNDVWITRMSQSHQDIATIVTGILLGAIVTLTSIGAGALGTVVLFLLYPLLPTVKLVGTEIAHAVPLTLVAGIGHASFGNVDWGLLVNLLIGSLPGIYLGSHLANRAAEKYLRPALAAMMFFAGSKLVL